VAAAILLAFAQSSSARSDLKDYTEQLLRNLDTETNTISDFIKAYDKADFQNESSISLFQRELFSHRSSFYGYLSFYHTTLPADAPPELRDAVNSAASGTEQILEGLDGINGALRNRDNAELRRGQDSLNAGLASLKSAIVKYNSWVDTYNAQTRNKSSSISSDDLGLGSAFATTLHYAGPLLYVYIYLLIAGFILTSSFRTKLKKLIAGEMRSEEFRGTPLYGPHLILLFPYLYVLLAFSVLLVWDFALVAIFIVSNLNRIPVALIIALFVVVVGSFWAIVQGFFGSKKRNILGVSLRREEQPRIWKLCDEVAQKVGTKTAHEIFLSPQPGIGVHLSGGLLSLLVGRTKRTLTIGMPSISALSVREMAAILAHEFGHFSNKDTAWNSLTFTMAAALQNTLSTMPNPWNTAGSDWIKLTSALNPALWVLLGYRLLFSVVTSGFSRVREVFADKTAIGLYGRQDFSDGLMKVARNDYIFSNHFVPDMLKKLTEEGKVYTNVFDTMDQAYKSIEANMLAGIDRSILNQEKPSMFDSHPLMVDRLAYAKYFGDEAKHVTEQGDFKNLFVKWDEVSKNMSNLYSYYVAVLTGYKFQDSEAKQQ